MHSPVTRRTRMGSGTIALCQVYYTLVLSRLPDEALEVHKEFYKEKWWTSDYDGYILSQIGVVA